MKRVADENENAPEPRLLLAAEMRDPLRVVCEHLEFFDLVALRGACLKTHQVVGGVERFTNWTKAGNDGPFPGSSSWFYSTKHIVKSMVSAKEHALVKFLVENEVVEDGYPAYVRNWTVSAYAKCGDLTRAFHYGPEAGFYQFQELFLKHGHFGHFFTVLDQFKNGHTGNFVYHAAQSGDLSMIRWAQDYTKKCKWVDVLAGGCRGNHISVVKVAMEHIPELNDITRESLIEKCIKGNSVECLQFILDLKVDIEYFYGAPNRDNQVDVIALLMARGILHFDRLKPLFKTCAFRNFLQTCKWLLEQHNDEQKIQLLENCFAGMCYVFSKSTKQWLQTTLAKYK